MQGASPNGAQPGLHLKPTDAAIGRVLALHCPGGRHGRQFRSKNTKHYQKSILRWLTYGRPKPKPVRISGPKTNPLLTSLMQRASSKCETPPRLELKSSRTFLAIKCCKRTKIRKVINSLTPIRVWAGTKNSLPVGFLQ